MKTKRTTVTSSQEPVAGNNRPSAPRLPADYRLGATGYRRPGFTLTELLVVVCIVALAVGLVLPSLKSMLAAGAEDQAIAAMSSTINAARGQAIQTRLPAAVHIQISPDGRCWAAIFRTDYAKQASPPPSGNNSPGVVSKGSPVFVPAEGFAPVQMPGNIAFGELVRGYFLPTDTTFDGMSDAQLDNFTTVNIFFGSDGRLIMDTVPKVPNSQTGAMEALSFATDATQSKVFGGASAGVDKSRIWTAPAAAVLNKNGCRALAVFDYQTLRVLRDDSSQSQGNRCLYLQNEARFIAIDPYTGQLLRSK